jgi:hypothetical protein
MIVANLALAKSVNIDCKVRCKLKCTFTIVNHDPKLFTVQATKVDFSRKNRISVPLLVPAHLLPDVHLRLGHPARGRLQQGCQIRHPHFLPNFGLKSVSPFLR